MSRLRAFFGYAWAAMALPIILATFTGNNFWAEKIVKGTGLKVSPWYTGGEVVQTIDHQQYQTLIHRAVFDGLVWKRNQGFVQINWQGSDDEFPGLIDEAIDYDRDGIEDFRIRLNTKTGVVGLIAPKPYVLRVEQVYRLKNERVVRVLLRNKH
jgi:hypothetical protein